ncbi:flavin reductase family protein [Streptomyces klenkii]|uniref:flavin reductase family protein n=1 Tax=Streptomyces klenkii TaxID=1420899 RepID=UPI001F54300C|nr:flavin reductase family protein [Streptomyces klenkii]
MFNEVILPGESGITTLPGQCTPETFRETLGYFCSGITVVTAVTPSGPVGFTCQAFSALSLSPPQVLLCPGRMSRTWPAIRSVGAFCVNVLAEDQTSLGDRFARSGAGKFDGVAWTYSPGGPPVLGGAAAWIECRLRSEFPGGDHTIVRADVRRLGTTPGSRPLVYFRGRYARITETALHPDIPDV